MYIAKAKQSVNRTPQRLASLRGRYIGGAVENPVIMKKEHFEKLVAGIKEAGEIKAGR